MNLGFDVVELGPADAPPVGETAPDFTRPLVDDEYWEDVALSELTDDGPVVLVFHTMDGDFPATYIWQAVRDRGWDDYDAEVVGLSVATPFCGSEKSRNDPTSHSPRNRECSYGVDTDSPTTSAS